MKRISLLFFILIISIFNFSFSTERNIYIVQINCYDQLFVEHEVMDIKRLKDGVKEFITNPNDNMYLSEKFERDIPLLGKTRVSKGLVSIQCARSTTYQKYIDVQNEIEMAFNELRNELALRKFNMSYKMLSKKKQRAINKAIPKSISEATPRYVERNGKLVENKNWYFGWYY